MSRPVGSIVWRNPAHPLTSSAHGECFYGVILGQRGVVQPQSVLGDCVLWDGCSATALFFYSASSGWLLDFDPAPGSMAAMQWIVGSRVRRTAERFDADAHFDISYNDQGTITQVADRDTCAVVWVRWDSRGEGRPALSYTLASGCLALISGPRVNAVVTACTTCGKPFPYEAPPSGVCAECTMIRGML